MKIHEYNEMMAYLMRPAQKKNIQTADLVDDLEPGSLKDELLKDFDPSQETYEEYLQRKSMRETAAYGGRMGFQEAGFVVSDNTAQTKLNFTKKQDALAEKLYGKSMKELYKTNRNLFFDIRFERVNENTQAGKGIKVKGNIQIPTKDVKQPDGKIKKIELPVRYPSKTVENKFIKAVKNIFKKPSGVIPFKTLAKDFPITERQAVRAAKQVKDEEGLKFPKGKTVLEYNKEVRKPLLDITSSSKVEKRMALERARFLKDQPEIFGKIDTAHRASKTHMAKLGLEFSTQTVGMDSRLINQVVLKPSENMLEKLYTKREGILDNIKGKPTDEQKKVLKQINDSVKKVIKTTSGRFVGIIVDPNTLEPSFSGIKKDLAFSKVNKTMKEIANLPGTPTTTGGFQGTSLKDSEYFKFIKDNVQKSVSGEIKRGFVPNDFKVILSDPKNRKNLLDYAKKNTPDIFSKFKKILNNPTSKKRFELYSKLPTAFIPAGIALSLISDQAEAADGTTEEGFSTGEKLAGAGVAGGAYAARKPILKTLGKIARPFGFPIVGAGFAAKELAKGKDANLGVAGADLLLPELIKKGASTGTGIMSKIGRVAANPFFKGARAFTPVGLGLMGIEGVRMGMREQDRINEMRMNEPDKYQEYLDELESYGDFSA